MKKYADDAEVNLTRLNLDHSLPINSLCWLQESLLSHYTIQETKDTFPLYLYFLHLGFQVTGQHI